MKTSGRGEENPARSRTRVRGAENAGNARRCTATKNDGTACRAPAVDGHACVMHTTRYSEAERQIWRKRGRLVQQKQALAPFPPCDFSTEEGCRRALELAGDAVLKGKLPNSTAQALAKLACVGMRAAELAAARKLADLESKLKDSTPSKRRRA